MKNKLVAPFVKWVGGKRKLQSCEYESTCVLIKSVTKYFL